MSALMRVKQKMTLKTAKRLASLAEIYVSKLSAPSIERHASTVGVADYLPAYAGFLVEKELTLWAERWKTPSVLCCNPRGAKVSDKIGVITKPLDRGDTIIIGGGMAYTFFKALGRGIALVLEADKVELAEQPCARLRKRK
jgi:phosphoglycerate kinase